MEYDDEIHLRQNINTWCNNHKWSYITQNKSLVTCLCCIQLYAEKHGGVWCLDAFTNIKNASFLDKIKNHPLI